MLNVVKITIIILILINIYSAKAKEIINIAVSSNFIYTMKKIKKEFEIDTKYEIKICSDSTSNLYTKIINGAPFDVFMSADKKHTSLLIKNKISDNINYTYAIGILILYSENNDINLKNIKKIKSKYLSLANYNLSPYGMATKFFFKNTKLKIKSNYVYGLNINQTLNFIKSGNSDIGFIALSQIKGINKKNKHWIIPEYLYPKIEQKLTIINNKNIKNSKYFLDYLKQKKIMNIITNSGYK